jgi:uncharacterized protein with NRDE domain
MCLLVFAWKTEPGFPLVVAANRDERLDRPAHAICVLQDSGPRILGGRDDLAGGTWLAVNEHGVVAGLTNRPSPGGRDPSKRSRGELPLMLAGQRSAEDGVREMSRQVQPGLYNPAWLLVGDRDALFYIELSLDQPPSVTTMRPGIHILENVGLGEPSPKVARIQGLLKEADAGGVPLWQALPGVLADHTVPADADADEDSGEGRDDGTVIRPAATLASCVHTDEYGTRSSALVRVPRRPETEPEVLVADGPPCTAPFLMAPFSQIPG